MSRRLTPTLADYAVVAISPLLIMVLVGSLVFFLITVFYHGTYDGRLNFITSMFVMAAVLIARISIVNGREHAILFAIPLAIVTAIALHRFVEFSGPLQSWSPLINLSLLGLIWWCADKLTWDSTVIDESADTSGEGLLQTAGLDDEATTLRSEQSAANASSRPARTWWQRFVDSRRRAHAPGVWVIYFSLGAIPVFGIGQRFIPTDDLDSRRYAFRLMIQFVGAALGLLLTTSLLNLRRYLRQRRLEMPATMAGSWLGIGSLIIVGLLVVCALLPRRNPEYAVTHLPLFAGSPTDLWTTEWAVGNEGQEDPEKADRAGEEPSQQQSGASQDSPTAAGSAQKQDDPSNASQSEPPSASGSPASSSSGTESSNSSAKGASQASESQQGQQSQGQQSQGQQSQGQQSQGQQSQGQQSQGQQSQGQQSQGQQSDSTRQAPSPSRTSTARGEQKAPDRGSPQSTPEGRQQSAESSGSEGSPTPQTRFDFSKIPQAIGGTLGQLLQTLYWVVALAVAGYLLWKYHAQILQALQDFWRNWLQWWSGRSPDKSAPTEESVTVQAPPPAFAEFADPFLAGWAQTQSPAQVVRYTFSALEAWAREHDCGRADHQTPTEFALHVARRHQPLARDAASLAEIYNRCAYSGDGAGGISLEPLRQLWQRLRNDHPR